jgi:hypothetical protein
MTTTDTKERIMSVGRLMVQAHGYNALSFREIGKEVGVSSASIHHHFPTKHERARRNRDVRPRGGGIPGKRAVALTLAYNSIVPARKLGTPSPLGLHEPSIPMHCTGNDPWPFNMGWLSHLPYQ